MKTFFVGFLILLVVAPLIAFGVSEQQLPGGENAQPSGITESAIVHGEAYVPTRLFVLFKESPVMGFTARQEMLASVLKVKIKNVKPLFNQDLARENWILQTKLTALESDGQVSVVNVRTERIRKVMSRSEARKKNGLDRAYVVEFEEDQDIPALVARLKEHAYIQDAESDRILEARKDQDGGPHADLAGIRMMLYEKIRNKQAALQADQAGTQVINKKDDAKDADAHRQKPLDRGDKGSRAPEKFLGETREPGLTPEARKKTESITHVPKKNWFAALAELKDKIVKKIQVYIADKWGVRKVTPDEFRGEATVIAVIGTGVDYDHEDFHKRIWKNKDGGQGDLNGDGCPGGCWVDEDENGLIDEDSQGCGRAGFDAFARPCAWTNDLAGDNDENSFSGDIRGWDFAGNNPDPMDDNGHGTSGARKIVNLAKRKKIDINPIIMPVKVLNKNGAGSMSNLLAAIEYAVANGAQILSIPLDDCSSSFALKMILGYARDAGVFAGDPDEERDPSQSDDLSAAGVSGAALSGKSGDEEGEESNVRLNLDGVKPLWERSKDAPDKRAENPYAQMPDELYEGAATQSGDVPAPRRFEENTSGEVRPELGSSELKAGLNTTRPSLRIPFPRFKSRIRDILRPPKPSPSPSPSLSPSASPAFSPLPRVSSSPVPLPSPKKEESSKWEAKGFEDKEVDKNVLAITSLLNAGNRSVRWSGNDPLGRPLKYSYRIDEGPWSKPTAIGSIMLSRSLKLGKHVFSVKAISVDGKESEEKRIEFETIKQKIDFKTAKKTAG